MCIRDSVNVVRLELPPLRQRKEDIPLLAARFIERFNRLQGKSVKGVDGEALSLLMAREWPGNIRELENVIERAFIVCGDGPIGVAHLPEDLIPDAGRSDVRASHDALDAQAIRTAIENAGGNREAAARKLGIHKTTLFRRIKRLGLSFPGPDGRSRRRPTDRS